MASKGFRSVRARSMVIAIATALAASMARAETISVPPCGSTPGTTTGSYSGLAIVTVSGSLVITPDNPDQDAFFNFNESSSFTPVSPNPDTFRFNRVSEGTCLCGFECPSTSHRVSDILVGPYPAYDPSHTYTVELDLGTAIAVPLHFGIYDCGCGDNSGELTVTIDSGSTVTTTTVPPPPPTTTTTLPLFCPPGTHSQSEPLQQDQPAWLTQELTLDSVRDGTILAAKERQTVAQRKVESHLSRLAWPNAALGGPRPARRRFGLQALRMSDPQSVYVRLKSMSARRVDRVTSAGLKIEVVNEKSRLIQDTCASSALPAVAALPFVTAIRPVDRAFTRVGHAETEGDAASRATVVRSLGYDGSGTSVGVLSDGIDHLADSQATGDLAPVTVPSDSRCHQGSGDEGTALLEIVHDLAPGAQLFFSGPTTSLEFIDSVNCLTAAGAKIIVDDIGFLNEPFFEDGPVASAVREAVQGGVSYHSAAGNDAMDYLEQAFRATPGSDFHDFLGGPIDNADDVLVPAFGSLLCVLQWNDPFGESGNDYDLFLLDENLNVVDESVGLQTGTQDPIEAVMATNPTGLTQRALVAIKKYAGDARTLKLVCKGGLAEQYATPAGSIFGHPAVQEVVTVGAIDVADQCLDDVERYSSEGPVDIAFPSPTERAKPDLAGFDGVSISNAGRFPPGCPPNCRFFGTSAAAPHSAAVAALLLSKNRTCSP